MNSMFMKWTYDQRDNAFTFALQKVENYKINTLWLQRL